MEAILFRFSTLYTCFHSAIFRKALSSCYLVHATSFWQRPLLLLLMMIMTMKNEVTGSNVIDVKSSTAIDASPTSLEVFREFCETEVFSASCTGSQVIIVRHALYGRMRVGRCVLRDYGYVGCYVDVLAHMDAVCSGTNRCEVRIPDPTLDRVNKCPRDFKTYLEISYECVQVQRADCSCDNDTITTTSATPAISAPFGFISRDPDQRPGCRNTAWCPVYIRASPGQQIKVNLLDYTQEVEEHDFAPQAMHGFKTCYRYAVILERTKSRETNVCGGRRGANHVYTSATHQIEIQLISTLVRDEAPKYLLQYQVIGCTDLEKKPNAVTKRVNQTTTISCIYGRPEVLRYQVLCVDNEWIGEIRKCPEADSSAVVITDVGLIGDTIEQSTGIFIGIVVGMAFLFGTTVLAIGLIILRRHRMMTLADTTLYSARSTGAESPTSLSGPYKSTMSHCSSVIRHEGVSSSQIRAHFIVADYSPSHDTLYNDVLYSARLETGGQQCPTQIYQTSLGAQVCQVPPGSQRFLPPREFPQSLQCASNDSDISGSHCCKAQLFKAEECGIRCRNDGVDGMNNEEYVVHRCLGQSSLEGNDSTTSRSPPTVVGESDMTTVSDDDAPSPCDAVADTTFKYASEFYGRSCRDASDGYCVTPAALCCAPDVQQVYPVLPSGDTAWRKREQTLGLLASSSDCCSTSATVSAAVSFSSSTVTWPWTLKLKGDAEPREPSTQDSRRLLTTATDFI